MAGVYLGGVYGGARSAILLNIPGAPSAIATAFDGYPIAQRGEAGAAIGLATVMSVIGGLVGIVVLAVAAPWVAEFAIRFQPRDYLMLAVLGLLLVGSLAGASLARGLVAAGLGLLVGTVGLDPLTAEERFTFGVVELWSGISPIAVMIGVFGVAEALVQLHDLDRAAIRQRVDRLIPSWKLVRRFLPLSLQTSLYGTAVGALPGTGGDIAALLAYDHAKRVTRKPSRPFGEGAWEGLVAPETANNAAVGGAYIPMLTLGIPGDAVTAVIIGALFIHGLNPGPMMLVEHPEMFWFTVGNLALANLCVLVLGLTGIRVFTRMVACPKALLIPLIVLLSVIGAYAINNAMVDVWFMLGFGVLGYFMRLYGYPTAPIVLGVILAPLIDQNWRRAVISVQEDPARLAAELVSTPISATLAAAIVLVLASRLPWRRLRV
jgi:putative tricarboxylic transport membrane protein